MSVAYMGRLQRRRSSGRALFYILVVLLTSFLPAAYYRLAPEPMVTPVVSATASLVYRSMVRDEDYWPSLRYGDFGCRTLFLRRPGVVFTGDSHSYAGWHFPDVGAKIQGRIGGCMMGGFYLESFLGLLDIMRHLPSPRVVIFGASPRMFWIAPDKDDQVAANIKALDGVVYNRQSLLAGVNEARALPFTAADYARSVSSERDRIAALSEANLAAQLDASHDTMTAIRLWIVRLQEPPLTMDATAQLVGSICTKIRALHTSLYVIHIPESPFLEGLYTASHWDDYIAKLSLFRACATRIVAERTAHYQLGNRHYANRELLSSLDYGVFLRKEPLRDPFAFDPDHLNRLGAVEFTTIALRELGLVQ
jgi:hypothetical protein